MLASAHILFITLLLLLYYLIIGILSPSELRQISSLMTFKSRLRSYRYFYILNLNLIHFGGGNWSALSRVLQSARARKHCICFVKIFCFVCIRHNVFRKPFCQRMVVVIYFMGNHFIWVWSLSVE